MRIININSRFSNSKRQIPIPKRLRFGKLVMGYWLLFGCWCLILSGVLLGCNRQNKLEQTQDYARQSQEYYQRAVKQYKNLIAQGKNLEELYLGLGQLYYHHGDFESAIEALKGTNGTQAEKLLAISYYRIANFTDALEIFHKQKIADDEYLYYHGLTCEKLNLFDEALESYKKIKDEKFIPKAGERIENIEKQASLGHIKDINPKVYKMLVAAPAQEEYAQAGALILLCDEKVEVTAEGRMVSSLHYLIKILNERGKEDFSETHIDYDSTYEKVELEYARTIKPDGQVIEVGSRHIRDVSRYLNFPLYSNARVYIISFPEITESAIIEYKVKVYRNQLIDKENFVLSYPLQAGEPIIAANFEVKIPPDKPLYIKIINDQYNDFGARLTPNIESKGDFLIYRWHFTDIPKIIPESNMPPQVQINPAMLISTFTSWEDIYNWWWKLSKDKIRADSAIKDMVSQLIKNQNSPEAKIQAIYNFCTQKIRYVAVEYGQAGYEPHHASDIFKNKYGDCKDQAILLVAMLREAGFVSWPVLIATKEYYNLNEDFPAVLFNHCIAAAQLKDKTVFLDPTAETCPFGDLPIPDQGRQVLIFKEDGYQIQDTPLYPAEHNMVKQHLTIKINHSETLSAEKSIFTYGVYDQAQRFWLLYTPPELIEQALKEKIQEISIGATLDKYNIENLNNLNEPIVLIYVFKGPEYFTCAGSLRIMPQLAGLDTSLVAKDKRRYAIDFGLLDCKETIVEIEVPENFALKYIPLSLTEGNKWLKLIVEYKQRSDKIYFRQKIELKENTISADEYPEFKKFFEGLAKKVKQRIVLERIR